MIQYRPKRKTNLKGSRKPTSPKRLLNEYNISYSSSRSHAGRKLSFHLLRDDRVDGDDDLAGVYHQLFDEAQKRYNEKQKRADRKIENYYEKIRTGKQEKTFHEIILQIGDREDMSAKDENGELAERILDEYFQSFQERNPYLKVFSAHLCYEHSPWYGQQD